MFTKVITLEQWPEWVSGANKDITQQITTCSKSTIEALEKGVKC